MDFQDAEARTVAERRREEERQRRLGLIHKEKVEAASKDMEGKKTHNSKKVLLIIRVTTTIIATRSRNWTCVINKVKQTQS